MTEFEPLLAALTDANSQKLFTIGVVFVGAFFLVFGIANLIRDLKTPKQQRIEDRLMGKKQGAKEKQAKTASGGKSKSAAPASIVKKHTLAGNDRGLYGVVARISLVQRLQQACLQADLEWNAAQLVVRLVLVGAVVAFGMTIAGFDPLRAAIIGSLFLICPWMYVIYCRKRRLNTLVEQLPDTFDMIGQALRSGQSLSAAVGLVAEQMPDPIGTEFMLVFQEQNLGVPFEEALGKFRDRMDQMDVTFFVTAVQIQRQSGGDLAEVLDKIGSVIRDRIKLYGQIRALTAEGRLSGWVLMSLPPIMLLVEFLMSPNYAGQLLRTEMGHWMLGAAAFSQFLGLIMIKKIVDVKY